MVSAGPARSKLSTSASARSHAAPSAAEKKDPAHRPAEHLTPLASETWQAPEFTPAAAAGPTSEAAPTENEPGQGADAATSGAAAAEVASDSDQSDDTDVSMHAIKQAASASGPAEPSRDRSEAAQHHPSGTGVSAVVQVAEPNRKGPEENRFDSPMASVAAES